MAHLLLSGRLNLGGSLKLEATGGDKVKVGTAEVLMQVGQNGSSQGKGIPVILPPPPAPKPLDDGTEVRIINSFNSGVTVKVGSSYLPVVASGITVQGDKLKIWPGMVLPSTVNATVKINGASINVVGDSGITLPNGGTVSFDKSGQ